MVPQAVPKVRARKTGKAKRRVRSSHKGVVLLPPDPKNRHAYWRARFVDPDTDRMTKVKLDPLALSTAEARTEWAKAKAKAIAKRRMELESGAPRTTGTELDKAIDRYYAAHPQLRDKTRKAYEGATDKLLSWARKSGVTSADDLTRAKLMELRTELVRARKKLSVRAAKRGAAKSSTKPRSPHTVNRELRSLRTVLGYLRDLDLFPFLTHDDLRRALKRLASSSERIEYLRPAELQKLVEAALRHDAEVFNETRDEHVGERKPGSTNRYDPIAPFVAFVLLTGCRLSEATALDWKQVDLDALDHEGRKVGEIHLRGVATKTHKPRTIGLEVSPALRAMLAAMKLASGGKGSVFGLSTSAAEAAAKRLRGDYPVTEAKGSKKPRKALVQYGYGAPESFTWQALRRTCGTFLTNAPGIFGASSAYRSAKQLGHSVSVAERHYVGVVRGIPSDARTLEAAMQIEPQALLLVKAAGLSGSALPRQHPGPVLSAVR